MGVFIPFDMLDHDGPVGIEQCCSCRSPSNLAASLNVLVRFLLALDAPRYDLRRFTLSTEGRFSIKKTRERASGRATVQFLRSSMAICRRGPYVNMSYSASLMLSITVATAVVGNRPDVQTADPAELWDGAPAGRHTPAPLRAPSLLLVLIARP